MSTRTGEPQTRRVNDCRLSAFARRYGDALRAGGGEAADLVIEQALSLGVTPAGVQATVIEPAMIRIGELWESGAISVADEHLATAISQRGLIRLFGALRVAKPRSRERVLLAAVEGQHHVLGMRMIADVLEGAGFDVLFLGADVPVGDLREFASRHQPAITGLGFGMAANVASLADSICAIHEVTPQSRIMLGGRALPPGLRDAGYPCVDSSLEVLYTVERMLADAPQSASPVVETLRSSGDTSWPRMPMIDEDPVAARLAEAVQDASDVTREYVRLAETYRDLAFTDQVTNLPNRRAFEERLAEVTVGVLLMIDVDEFKTVNDTLGHDAGDQLLSQIGQAVVRSTRARDFAARVGGDEFAVILPSASSESAREITTRIRQAVGQIRPVTTISIGMASLAQNRRAAQLAADSALYEAKATGRDRVVEAKPNAAAG